MVGRMHVSAAQQIKERPKGRQRNHASSFDATVDVDKFLGGVIELHCSLHINLEKLVHALPSPDQTP